MTTPANPPAGPLMVWAVIFSNYEPVETDSLWTTEERAEERAEELGDGWRVVSWLVSE